MSMFRIGPGYIRAHAWSRKELQQFCDWALSLAFSRYLSLQLLCQALRFAPVDTMGGGGSEDMLGWGGVVVNSGCIISCLLT